YGPLGSCGTSITAVPAMSRLKLMTLARRRAALSSVLRGRHARAALKTETPRTPEIRKRLLAWIAPVPWLEACGSGGGIPGAWASGARRCDASRAQAPG